MDTSRQSYIANVLKDKLHSFVLIASPILEEERMGGARRTGPITDPAAENVGSITDQHLHPRGSDYPSHDSFFFLCFFFFFFN